MKSSARIFFAGVGTIYVILGVGFGGGMFLANAALKEPMGYQVKAKADLPTPARVILPTTAEAAQPSEQQVPQQDSPVEPRPSPEPVKVAAAERPVERVDTKKIEIEARERRKRDAQRKAKREVYRARQQPEQRVREQPRILAFEAEEPRQTAGFGFFGNN